MAKSRVLVSRSSALRLRALVPVLIVSLSVGGAAAGCSSDAGSSMTEPMATTGDWVTPVAAVPMGSMTMPTAEEIATTWAARPAYVNALPADWQAAYAFALARPVVVQWLPCYCGCDGISHRSNLDCFFQRREVKGTYVYEEHASYCDICVRTANMASDMLEQGKTMVQIRDAVDSTFSGGAAPGTDTPMPPA